MRLIAFILFAFSATAQFPETLLMNLRTNAAAEPPSAWGLTNAANCLGFWSPESAITNPDSVTNLPDLSGHGYDWTNRDTGLTPHAIPYFSNAVLNGKAALAFNGTGTFLKNVSPLGMSNTQPVTIWMLLCMGQNSSGYAAILASDNSNVRFTYHDQMNETANKMRSLAGSAYYDYGGVSNRWTVTTVVFDGASSRVYTNNVLSGSGNPGSNPMGKMMLGAESTSSYYYGMLGDLAIYGGVTNTVAEMGSNYWYYTNKYGVMP